MTREDLINKIATNGDMTKKQATIALKTFLDSITEALKEGERVSFVGFGTFNVVTRKARKAINPRTKEKIDVPERKVPVFKAGSKLKEAVK